jgi:hypothetical protein
VAGAVLDLMVVQPTRQLISIPSYRALVTGQEITDRFVANLVTATLASS